MLTLFKKYLYHQIQYSKTWESKCLNLMAQTVRAFGMNPNFGGSGPPPPPPSGRDNFCLKDFETFTRTPVRVSKMNDVARTQLKFQLNLRQKYLCHQSQYSKTWESKCLALIAQMAIVFGMNLKVGGWRPPQIETFSVSKPLTPGRDISCLKNVDTVTRTSVRVSKMNDVARAHN